MDVVLAVGNPVGLSSSFTEASSLLPAAPSPSPPPALAAPGLPGTIRASVRINPGNRGGAHAQLGVHWMTDVLGGWAFGACWLAVVITGWITLTRHLAAGRLPVHGDIGPCSLGPTGNSPQADERP